jgi:WD40 repeat protein
MENTIDEKEMATLFDRFMRSFVENRDPRLDLELNDLSRLRGSFLAKAKTAILNRLEKRPDEDAIVCAKVAGLSEAIPLMEQWLKEIRLKPDGKHGSSAIRGQLALTLYEFTKNESYIPDVIDTVRQEGYADYKPGIYWLSKMPLTMAGITAVWEKYKNGNIADDTSHWVRNCADFLREKIKEPIGQAFLNNLPEAQRIELLELIRESYQERLERKWRREKYFSGREFYDRGDVNRYDEYTKIGASPVKGMQLRSIWKGHSEKINSLTWSPDGEYLASTSNDETLVIWDFEKDDYVKILTRDKKERYFEYRPKQTAWIDGGETVLSTYEYSFTPGEDLFGIAIWDIQNETVRSSMKNRNKDEGFTFTSDFVYLPDEKIILLSRFEEGEYRLYQFNINSYESKPVLQQYTGSHLTMALARDGKRLAAGHSSLEGDDHRVIIHDLVTDSMTHQLQGHAGYINDVHWMPNEELLITASTDGTIRIWDLEQRQEKLCLQGLTGSIDAVSISAGGELLAVKSSKDHAIQIWSTQDWQLMMILRELDGYRNTIAFHPRLPFLATLCHEESATVSTVNSIRIWEFDYDSFNSNPPFMEGFEKREAEIREKLSEEKRS